MATLQQIHDATLQSWASLQFERHYAPYTPIRWSGHQILVRMQARFNGLWMIPTLRKKYKMVICYARID